MVNQFKIINLLCFSILLSNMYSQNLVLNPCFEQTSPNYYYSKIPIHGKDFNAFFKEWSNPGLGSPDIYISNDSRNLACPIIQIPRTGNIMVGIICYSPGTDLKYTSSQDWHEYVQGTLEKELTIGKKYYAEFWVLERDKWVIDCENKKNKLINLHNKAVASCNNIGILLTDTLIKLHPHRLALKGIPPINAQEIIQTEGNNWIKISGYFIADKNYKYLTIGNFFSDSETSSTISEDDRITVQEPTTNKSYKIERQGYYFIDDVKIEEVNDDTMQIKPDFKEGASIVLNKIYFKTGESVLLPTSFIELDKMSESLQKVSNIIETQGHTDNIGSESSNIKLSEERAKSVYNYLILKKGLANKLIYKGYGSSQPIASNQSETGRQLNRRVQLFVVNNRTLHIIKDTFPQLSRNIKKAYKDTLLQIYQFKEQCKEDYQFSRIGLYSEANMSHCNSVEEQKLRYKDSIDFFTNYKPSFAFQYILKKAIKAKAIFINETHHNPQQRAFTTTLLKSFYDQGYRYIGFESFDKNDSTRLINSGYPSIKSGYYITEPVYGDLVRYALSIGLKVFAYETTDNEKKDAINFLRKNHDSTNKDDEIEVTNPDGSKTTMFEQNLEMSARDWVQAKHVSDIYKKDPSAKVIVHCGYGHIKEKNSNGWMPMAFQFKKMTGIDPLTIEQSIMSETCESDETALFKILKNKLKTPLVFINKNDSAFVLKEFTPYALEQKTRFYDIQVFHPKSVYLNGRPDWLMMNGYRKPYIIDTKMISIELPCLIFAYKNGEKEEIAIPMDVIQLDSKSDICSLLLPIGQYSLFLRNKNNDKQRFKININ